MNFEWQDPNQVIGAVKAMLEERGRAIRRVPANAVRRGTFELLAMIKDRAPKKTTVLVKSISAVVQQLSDDMIEGRVGTWLKYARYLEEGTGIFGPAGRPITIVARNKKALFWGAYNGDGKAIMAKSVTIMGIRPREYFASSVRDFLPRYVAIIEEELAKEMAA
jgi:hypothetical protein